MTSNWLTVIGGADFRIIQGQAEGIDEIQRLGRKRNKARCVVVKVGRSAHQLAINPEAADPVGEQQHGIEHLFLDARQSMLWSSSAGATTAQKRWVSSGGI
jgi:hypothetical protein